MKKIVSYMLGNKLLVNLVLIMTFSIGMLSLSGISREAYPSVNLNKITVTTTYPGASADDVELNVTVPIERVLNGISGVESYTSTSTENISVITIQADENLDKVGLQSVLDDIKSAVDGIDDLPKEIDGRPVIAKIDIDKQPIIELTLTGPLHKIRAIAKSLENELRKVKGVGTITKVGYYDTEVYIEVDPLKMKQYYISFDEVSASISARNIRASGGTLKSYIGQESVVTLSKFQKLTDVKNVILRSNFEQRRVLVKDVASIKITEEDTGLLVRNNGSRSISLAISKKNGADIITTIDNLKQYINHRSVPEDVRINYINDLSRTTRAAIASLETNALLGMVLVIIILILFLNTKTALWCAFSIPFSIISAFIFLPMFGLTLNNIVLGGFMIVIGMLVDDAIVTAEHIESYREQGLSGWEAAKKGAAEMIQPVTAAVATTIAAYLPMMFLGGIPGKFIIAIPIVVALTLLASLFDTFLLLPSHLAHLSPKKKGKSKFLERLESIYKRSLTAVFRHSKLYVTGIVILFFGTIIFAGRGMNFILFPNDGSDTLIIKYEGPMHWSKQRTEKEVIKVEKLLLALQKKHGEIAAFSSRIGHQQSGTSTRNSGSYANQAVTTIYLTPAQNRTRDGITVLNDLRRLAANTGLQEIKTYFEVKGKGPTGKKPVSIVVTGNNAHERETVIRKLISYLKTIPGVSDIDRDDKQGKNQLVVRPDYTKIAAANLTTANISSTLRIAFDGQKVTSLQTLDEEIWYRILLPEQLRGRKKSIQHLQVRNSGGQLINMNQLVKLKSQPAKQDYFHYNGYQCVTVSAEVDNVRTTAVKVANQIEKKWKKTAQIPLSVSIIIEGDAKDSRETMGGFVYAMLICLVGIFFIVALVLKSLSKTAIVMISIPLVMIGVTWGLVLHGQNFTMFSLMGILGLMGIVVNDTIVMLDRFNSALPDKQPATDEQIVNQAATRLRPIMLTTLTTVGGMLPAVYGLGGKDPFITGLATAVSYGLLVSSFITLFLTPVLYRAQRRKTEKKATARSSS